MMRSLVAMAAVPVIGCAADFGCDHLKSTAHEPGGDEAFVVEATRCEDGVDKRVECTAAGAGWDCQCVTDGEVGGSLSDPQAFYDTVTSPAQHQESLDKAMLLAGDDCGW